MKSSTRTPSQDVTLHYLRHLSINAFEAICVIFFKYVHMPALDTLHIEYNPDRATTSSNAVPKVLELTASILPSHTPFTELRLFLDNTFHSWGGFSLGTDTKIVTKIKTTPQEYAERDMSFQALLKFSTKLTPWMEHINFLEFSGFTLRPTIRTLQDSLFAWEKLTDFPSLRTIRMKHYRIPALLEAMYEHAMECIGIGFETSPRPGAPITQLIPKLETIEFEDFEFEPKMLDIIHGVGLIDLLMAYLWAVKKHTGSCPRVVFKKCCGVNVHWLKELRSFTEVEWDGSGVDLDPLEKWYSSFSPDIPEFTFEGHIEWYKSINLWG
ncbi:hypothetical protein ONZ45_g5304 [Pleurotus djamor]|nr:hypothetical protein ONZ45_g5304 [Pleurotus djamor]